MNIERGLSPLTLIAIFAGVVEASALASLPFLSEKSQMIYTWFLVGFPFFLTVLFFLTLNFNHQTLYMPTAQEAPEKPNTSPSPPAQPNAMSSTGERRTLAFSGPEAGKLIEAHILRIIRQPHPQQRTWLLHNLDTRLRIHLTVEELADDTQGPGH